jgi:hypothetical protein
MIQGWLDQASTASPHVFNCFLKDEELRRTLPDRCGPVMDRQVHRHDKDSRAWGATRRPSGSRGREAGRMTVGEVFEQPDLAARYASIATWSSISGCSSSPGRRGVR